MTESCCWIDSLDDVDFNRLTTAAPFDLALRDRFWVLPEPPAGHYWINVFREWAQNKGVQTSGTSVAIQAHAPRNLVLTFLKDVFGSEAAPRMRMYHYARDRFDDSCTYLICADEF